MAKCLIAQIDWAAWLQAGAAAISIGLVAWQSIMMGAAHKRLVAREMAMDRAVLANARMCVIRATRHFTAAIDAFDPEDVRRTKPSVMAGIDTAVARLDEVAQVPPCQDMVLLLHAYRDWLGEARAVVDGWDLFLLPDWEADLLEGFNKLDEIAANLDRPLPLNLGKYRVHVRSTANATSDVSAQASSCPGANGTTDGNS